MATEMTKYEPETDLVVVGGGLAGLASAALAARSGQRVLLLEKAAQPGGRAQSYRDEPFVFNLGPHALYRKGPAARLLRELGVRWTGGIPAVGGSHALSAGRMHRLPGTGWSLLRTTLLGWRGKLEAARLLGALGRLRTAPLEGTSVQQWLDTAIRQPDARALMGAMLRLSTYSDDPALHSAGAALAQLKLAASGGVDYVDGGWQSLVDRLREVAEAAGVTVRTGARVSGIEHDGAVRGVRLADGTLIRTSAVVVAASPARTSALVDGGKHPELSRWTAQAVPIRAACLNLALDRLPRPRVRFALGIDRPLYYSVHSTWARLAPQGQETVYAMKYLSHAESDDPARDERELEAMLDLTQPGWRQHVRARRFLPSMTVAQALPEAARGGTAGRPGPSVPGIDGLFVAGDWVGGEGLLCDAALASARQATLLALRPRRSEPRRLTVAAGG